MEKNRETKNVTMSPAARMPRFCKINHFNKHVLFGMDTPWHFARGGFNYAATLPTKVVSGAQNARLDQTTGSISGGRRM